MSPTRLVGEFVQIARRPGPAPSCRGGSDGLSLWSGGGTRSNGCHPLALARANGESPAGAKRQRLVGQRACASLGAVRRRLCGLLLPVGSDASCVCCWLRAPTDGPQSCMRHRRGTRSASPPWDRSSPSPRRTSESSSSARLKRPAARFTSVRFSLPLHAVAKVFLIQLPSKCGLK